MSERTLMKMLKPYASMRLQPLCAFMLLAVSVHGCGPKPADTKPEPDTGTTQPKVQPAPSPAPEPQPKTPTGGPSTADGKDGLKVEIGKGVFAVNGAAIPIPGNIAGFEKGFGKPTSTNDRGGVYRAVYWQPLGIKSLQEKSGEQRIVTLEFHFEKYDDPFDNVKCEAFPGPLIVDGERIAKDTDMDELAKTLGSLKKTVAHWEIQYPGSGMIHIDTSLNLGPKGKLVKGVRKVLFEKLR